MNVFKLSLCFAVISTISACGASNSNGSVSGMREGASGNASGASRSFSVMTYNVLRPSGTGGPSEQDWESRRQLVVQQIREARPDIVLLQEVEMRHPVDTAYWMRDQLTQGDMPISYAIVAGSGEDPKDIYVNRDVFEIVFPGRNETSRQFELYGGTPITSSDKADSAHNTVYLPPDPLTVCASDSNAAQPMPLRKTASWVHLRHLRTKEEIVVANLHLHWQHESPRDNYIRSEQLRCISTILSERYASLPKIIGGDFNAELGSDELNDFQSGFGQKRATFTCAAAESDSAAGTWNGFCADCTPAIKIDHLFVQQVEIEVSSHALHQKFEGRWPSDHCPLMATFRL